MFIIIVIAVHKMVNPVTSSKANQLYTCSINYMQDFAFDDIHH